MEQLKLISVRLNKEVVDEIDDLAKKHSYWTRSHIINSLLYACMRCARPGTLFDMISTLYPDDKKIHLYFGKDEDLQELIALLNEHQV